MNALPILPELTCIELVELVTNYLEAALTPSEIAQVAEHLAQCPPCYEYVEQMRRTIVATSHLRKTALAPAHRERLLALFRSVQG